MSSPPHRDLPIEWRTETGEFIGAPDPRSGPLGASGAGQPGPGWPGAGHPGTGGIGPGGPPEPPGVPPQEAPPGPPPELPPGLADGPQSAEEFFGGQVAADEHRAAVRLRVIVAVLAVIGIGVTWALGGFAAAPEPVVEGEGIPTVAVNEVAATGPYNLTVERAAVLTEFGGYHPDGDILVLVFTAEVTANRTYAINEAITLDGVDGLAAEEPARMLNTRDGDLAFYLQPGLPERLAFLWDMAPGAAVPDEIEVVLNGADYRRPNFAFDTEYRWFGPFPRARVIVAVEDRRGQ